MRGGKRVKMLHTFTDFLFFFRRFFGGPTAVLSPSGFRSAAGAGDESV